MIGTWFSENWMSGDFISNIAAGLIIFALEIAFLVIFVPGYLRFIRDRRLKEPRSLLMEDFIGHAYIRFHAIRDVLRCAWCEGDIQAAIDQHETFNEFRNYYEQQANLLSFAIDETFAKFVHGSLSNQGAMMRAMIIKSARRHGLPEPTIFTSWNTELADNFTADEILEKQIANVHYQAAAIDGIDKAFRRKGYRFKMFNILNARDDEFLDLKRIRDFTDQLRTSADALRQEFRDGAKSHSG
ncbi:MAG: hypothetical protein AAFR21_01195 [Pseudomonadota bacterium]